MQTYISDIIPKLQRFSKKLDNKTYLCRKNWSLITDNPLEKIILIFNEPDQLLISNNGKVSYGTWNLFNENTLVLDTVDSSNLYKHGFIDDEVLVIKLENASLDYSFLVSEHLYENGIRNIGSTVKYLNDNYLGKNDILSSKSSTVNNTFAEDKKEYDDENDWLIFVIIAAISLFLIFIAVAGGLYE